MYIESGSAGCREKHGGDGSMNTVKTAFRKSLPVMAGYIILGIGFGILAHRAGYGFPWVLSMSLLIFAGSMQYVGVGLLAGGASVLTVILTTVMVNARHLFYSISMIRKKYFSSENVETFHV